MVCPLDVISQGISGSVLMNQWIYTPLPLSLILTCSPSVPEIIQMVSFLLYRHRLVLILCVCTTYVNQMTWNNASEGGSVSYHKHVHVLWLCHALCTARLVWQHCSVSRWCRTSSSRLWQNLLVWKRNKGKVWGGAAGERKWLMGKMKFNFLFPQQPPEKQGHSNPSLLLCWSPDTFWEPGNTE